MTLAVFKTQEPCKNGGMIESERAEREKIEALTEKIAEL
jgi:hypothetical protein